MNDSVSPSAPMLEGKAEPVHETPESPAIGNGIVCFGTAATAQDSQAPPLPAWADGKGLPTYFAAECPVCDRPREPQTCHGCGKSLQTIPEPSVRGSGYQSHTYGHFHFKELGGLAAREPITGPLCLECYRVDFSRAYPGQASPV